MKWKKQLMEDMILLFDQDIKNYEREVMETEGIRSVVHMLQSKGIDTIVNELFEFITSRKRTES
jgi:hypothetical protein